jgi:hypothetical protein
MAMTPAERQRAYRARRKAASENGERKLSTWVPTGTLLDLRRLAAHNGVTVRAMLERLIAAEVERLIEKLSDQEFDSFLALPVNPKRRKLPRNAGAPTRTEGEQNENGATEP